MKALFRYEFLRFYYQKKNWAIFLITLLLLTGFIGYNWYQDIHYVENRVEKLQEVVDIGARKVNAASMVASMSEDPQEKEKLTEEALLWQDINSRSYDLLAGYMYEENRTPSFLKEENAWVEQILKARKAGIDTSQVENRTDQELRDVIRKNEYIIKNNIEIPESPYHCSFFNLIGLLFTGYNPILLSMIFMLFVFDIFAAEFDNSSYKIMYSMKLRRKDVYAAKYITACGIAAGLLALIFAVFLIMSIFFGIGDMQYPVLAGEKIITIVQADILQFMTYLFGVLFFFAFLEITSYLSCSTVTTLTFSIALYVMLIMFAQMLDIKDMYAYIPFYTIYCSEILQSNGIISSICISIAGTILLYLIGNLVFNKKDIKVE